MAEGWWEAADNQTMEGRIKEFQFHLKDNRDRSYRGPRDSGCPMVSFLVEGPACILNPGPLKVQPQSIHEAKTTIRQKGKWPGMGATLCSHKCLAWDEKV